MRENERERQRERDRERDRETEKAPQAAEQRETETQRERQETHTTGAPGLEAMPWMGRQGGEDGLQRTLEQCFKPSPSPY